VVSPSNWAYPGMPRNIPVGSGPVSPDELRALRLARGAALTSLISLILTLLSPIVIILVSGFEIHYVEIHIGSGKFSNSVFEDLLAVLSIGFFVALVAVILYLLSFSAFKKVQSGFGGPRALVLIGVVGTLLVFVGLVAALEEFLMVSSCVATNTTSSCVSIATLYGPVLAIFFGLVLAFVGWIGLIIGIYRVGSRYNSTPTKVGAILTIIPVVALVAPILILIGVSGSLREARSRAGVR
jgi:hypothetical protein